LASWVELRDEDLVPPPAACGRKHGSSAKLSVVMFGAEAGPRRDRSRRNAAAVSRACVTKASERQLEPKAPSRFAFGLAQVAGDRVDHGVG